MNSIMAPELRRSLNRNPYYLISFKDELDKEEVKSKSVANLQKLKRFRE